MRFPNQRLAQLFDLLQNETLPQDELAQRLSVSTRTVRADITALNALLASHGAQFVLSRGNGYQLKIDDAERYQQLQASHPRALRIPRTGPERVHYLVVRFLTSAFSLKLEDLADEWFVSRATLQSDMVEVREWFHRYNLTLETRPRHGMKLFDVHPRVPNRPALGAGAAGQSQPAGDRSCSQRGCAGADGGRTA